MKTVAFIPIKKYSERLSGKNFLILSGKPLFQHIVNTLEKSNVDEIYVWCSDYIDSPYYLSRETWINSDTTKANDLVKEFSNQINADIYVLAHATSPFITKETVNKCIENVKTNNCNSSFAAVNIPPMVWKDRKPLYNIESISRTQDASSFFHETTSLYVYGRELAVQGLRIGDTAEPVLVSLLEGLDIDYPEDFELAEKFARI